MTQIGKIQGYGNQLYPFAGGDILKYLGNVVVTKMLIEQRLRVRFMYRDEPKDNDSGWRFLCGLEDKEYLDNPENLIFCDINTLLEIDPEVELHQILHLFKWREDGVHKPSQQPCIGGVL